MKRIAIDPGDEHVGWVYDGVDGMDVGEHAPTASLEFLIHMCSKDAVDEIIVEEFRLYEREYANQTWSPMLTSQLIGAIKLVGHMFRIPVIEQGAYIKKPTRAKMKARGIQHHPGSIHSRDAELHLYYRKWRST